MNEITDIVLNNIKMSNIFVRTVGEFFPQFQQVKIKYNELNRIEFDISGGLYKTTFNRGAGIYIVTRSFPGSGIDFDEYFNINVAEDSLPDIVISENLDKIKNTIIDKFTTRNGTLSFNIEIKLC